MKNILFIAPYRQNDGWGLAAKDYAKALETTKHNIAIRPIYMSNSIDNDIDEQLKEMESRSFDNYDMVIQKVLPHLFEKSKIPSIGLFTLEVNNLKACPWYDNLQIMDGIMVPSTVEKDTIESAGIRVPTYAISEPVDTEKFKKEWGRLDIIPSNTFNFYFIGEYIPRKNLDALIKAFHVEFHRSEPVNLIIKTNLGGVNSQDLSQIVSENAKAIKQRMRIYNNPAMYKPELIITGRLSDDEMCQLHNSCDCFVMPSRGEALCRPAVDALGFGKTPIVTDNTGMVDFISDTVGWVVPSIETPIDTHTCPLPYLYTGRETWYDIDILALGGAMRQAYETKAHPVKVAEGKRIAEQNFSHEFIGKKIERAIDEFDSRI